LTTLNCLLACAHYETRSRERIAMRAKRKEKR
jgi:hypothetical protein